jgi:hypothetical protein
MRVSAYCTKCRAMREVDKMVIHTIDHLIDLTLGCGHSYHLDSFFSVKPNADGEIEIERNR